MGFNSGFKGLIFPVSATSLSCTSCPYQCSLPFSLSTLYISSLSLRRADHSSRGFLPTVVRRCVWSRNLKNEEAVTRVGSQRHKKKVFLPYASCNLFIYLSFILYLGLQNIPMWQIFLVSVTVNNSNSRYIVMTQITVFLLSTLISFSFFNPLPTAYVQSYKSLFHLVIFFCKFSFIPSSSVCLKCQNL